MGKTHHIGRHVSALLRASGRRPDEAPASLLAGGFMALGLLASVPAVAQEADTTGVSAADELMEVQITGTRIVRDGFEAPTPVKVVSAEQLAAAAPTGLSDALNQLPEFKNSLTPANTGVNTTGNAGQSFLNLRSLGAERTLILLDGRRVVPSTSTGTTDISILPEPLVKRVDVVTGGASAAYGSDAVAGVVNFVLDTEFTGFKAQTQYGKADAGDAENYKIAVTAGTPLFDGRGHLIGSFQFYSNEGVETYASRDWFRSCSRIPNPALNPATIVTCGVTSAQFTPGGLITAGPLRGTQFGPGGVPMPFVYGDLATASAMVGGSGMDHALYYQPVPGVKRKTAFTRFSYELTDNVTGFFEALYADASAEYNSTRSWEGQGTAYTIYKDNAFLPASIVQAMDDLGIDSFSLSRYNYDFGALEVSGRNNTARAVAGVDAQIGGWTLNAYYEYGQNDYRQTIDNNPNVNRLYNAVDAVINPATGQIVCRSTLTQPDNGCIPLNIFGHGSPSPDALAWVLGTTVQDLKVKQQVFEISISGEPFSTWAGPVSMAFGAGWREESSDQRTDPISQSLRTYTGGYLGWPTSVSFRDQVGAWERNNPLPLRGSYDVKEVFHESVVPLASGKRGAERLEFNGAVRYTDYSTSGGVTSWKAGLVYEPVQEIRFRATHSRDIRAPNITELYRGSVQGQSTLTDPFQPVGSPARNPFVLGRSYGNPNLKPEIADTDAFGIVYQPSWLPGFSASVDYYDIEVEDAIVTLGAQTTIDQCYAGTTSLCQYITRDENGVIAMVDSPFLNVASRATSGLDIELAYRTQASRLVSSWAGDLTFRAFANYISKLTTTTPGAPTIDTAGQTGPTLGGAGAVPDWSATFSVRYDSGQLSVYVQERFIASGKLDVTLTPLQLAPEQNRVSSVYYADLTVNYRPGIGRDLGLEAYLTVNNLFDRDPPSAPGAFFVFGTSATNTSLFDTVGRAYAAGLRFRF